MRAVQALSLVGVAGFCAGSTQAPGESAVSGAAVASVRVKRMRTVSPACRGPVLPGETGSTAKPTVMPPLVQRADFDGEGAAGAAAPRIGAAVSRRASTAAQTPAWCFISF